MDFSFTQAQDELSALSRRILTDLVTPQRLAELDAGGDSFDRQTWTALAAAGILSAALPEQAGGAGYGLAEQCSILIEIGRAVAPVPYLPSVVLGAGAIAEFGTPDQVARWAVPAAAGELLVTAALTEPDGEDPCAPSTRAEQAGASWLLTGTKTTVPAGTHADLILVPAATGAEVTVFVVERSDPGVTIKQQHLVADAGAAQVELDGVRLPAERALGRLAVASGGLRSAGNVPVAGSAGAAGQPDHAAPDHAAPDHAAEADDGGRPDVAGWLADRATIGLCALQLGVTERALELTAQYARQREQFGRPIGAFQAVAQRLADAHIDVAGIRLTMWQAAWLLEQGQPCQAEIATAKYWAADAGHRVAHTAVHIHGGVGIDTSYPLHRYFTAAKECEFSLGGATEQLIRLGAVLAG